jgi:hypothetical protein
VGTNIEHRVLPTRGELQKSRLNNLARTIEQAQLNENAPLVLTALENETDLANIALKAISLLLEQEKANGPEKIGLDEQTFAKVIKRLAGKGDSKSRGSFRKRRPSGNRDSNRNSNGGRDKPQRDSRRR